MTHPAGWQLVIGLTIVSLLARVEVLRAEEPDRHELRLAVDRLPPGAVEDKIRLLQRIVGLAPKPEYGDVWEEWLTIGSKRLLFELQGDANALRELRRERDAAARKSRFVQVFARDVVAYESADDRSHPITLPAGSAITHLPEGDTPAYVAVFFESAGVWVQVPANANAELIDPSAIYARASGEKGGTTYSRHGRVLFGRELRRHPMAAATRSRFAHLLISTLCRQGGKDSRFVDVPAPVEEAVGIWSEFSSESGEIRESANDAMLYCRDSKMLPALFVQQRLGVALKRRLDSGPSPSLRERRQLSDLIATLAVGESQKASLLDRLRNLSTRAVGPVGQGELVAVMSSVPVRERPDGGAAILGFLDKGTVVEHLDTAGTHTVKLSMKHSDGEQELSAPWVRIRVNQTEGWGFGGHFGKQVLQPRLITGGGKLTDREVALIGWSKDGKVGLIRREDDYGYGQGEDNISVCISDVMTGKSLWCTHFSTTMEAGLDRTEVWQEAETIVHHKAKKYRLQPLHERVQAKVQRVDKQLSGLFRLSVEHEGRSVTSAHLIAKRGARVLGGGTRHQISLERFEAFDDTAVGVKLRGVLRNPYGPHAFLLVEVSALREGMEELRFEESQLIGVRLP